MTVSKIGVVQTVIPFVDLKTLKVRCVVLNAGLNAISVLSSVMQEEASSDAGHGRLPHWMKPLSW